MRTKTRYHWIFLAAFLLWAYLLLKPEPALQMESPWSPPLAPKQTITSSYAAAPAQTSGSSASPITVTNMTISEEKMNRILASYSSDCYSPSPGVVHFRNWVCIRNDYGSWDAQRY